MEENKNLEVEKSAEMEEKQSIFNFQTIYTMIILNWQWFILSVIICIGIAYVKLRYTTPIYQTYAKLLIKDEDNANGYNSNIKNAANLGIISNSNGIDNEMEILKSHSIAVSVVKDLKLYTTYKSKGKIVDHLLYKYQPISVDMDESHLEKLNSPISLEITRDNDLYKIKGTYYYVNNKEEEIGPIQIIKETSIIPLIIGTRAGNIYITKNMTGSELTNGETELVTITSPDDAAYKYAGELNVSQTSKTTTIAQLALTDEIPGRALDYLKQLSVCYNRQANEDKNEVAVRTEAFINNRLEKINAELGNTEGAIEAYKKSHKMVELKMNADAAVGRSNEIEQQLADANTQTALLNSIARYMNEPANKYQTLPTNVGLTDASATSLINKYNEIVLERNRLLRSASENSPTVAPLTSQLDDLSASIRRAMNQTRRNMAITRRGVEQQYGKYLGQIYDTPSQERTLTQIGRQQEVKSGLYLMLLQKREENSISLAATADKGKLIDDPSFGGQVSPKRPLVMLIALIIGLGLPFLIFILNEFFKYKIEGHEDVEKLTNLPIIADVAVASETAKSKADIVVHENKNNHMEEIFRSMRTNLQFIMKEEDKVILCTSTISGEGKTFISANLAVSFALLGKKVILVGLDIRKPRLAELFEINNHHTGITNLLTKTKPTEEDIKKQILPSGVSNNLDMLMAGPIPPNPAELIARQSLEDVMTSLRKMYDYIIIDTAPLGLVSDTIQISRAADVTIYVCRADYTTKDSFGLINSVSDDKKLPKVSIVINGIDMSKKKYGYYYGYGKYGKYGKYAYGKYGYGKGGYGRYGNYGKYGHNYYGSYNTYSDNKYANANDTSIKTK